MLSLRAIGGLLASIAVLVLGSSAAAKTTVYNFGLQDVSLYWDPVAPYTVGALEVPGVAPEPDSQVKAKLTVYGATVVDVIFGMSWDGGDRFYDDSGLPNGEYPTGIPNLFESDYWQVEWCSTLSGCVTAQTPQTFTATLSGPVTKPYQYACGPGGIYTCGPYLMTCPPHYGFGGGCFFFNAGTWPNELFADLTDIAPDFHGTLVITDVPEPKSWALLIAGFAGMGAALRRARWGRPAAA